MYGLIWKLCDTLLSLRSPPKWGATWEVRLPYKLKKRVQLSGWLTPESLSILEGNKKNPISSPFHKGGFHEDSLLMDLHSLLWGSSYDTYKNNTKKGSLLGRARHVCPQKEGVKWKVVTFFVPCWCFFVGERNNF